MTYAVQVAIRCLRTWRFKRVLVFSYGEPANVALVNAVQLARQEETVPTRSPKERPLNTGAVETVNKMVEILFRTLRASVEQ